MTTSSYHKRRAKKNRIFYPVVYFMCACFVFVVIGWISIPVRSYLDHRSKTRVANLDYPTPSANFNEHLIFKEHLGAINISTPRLPITGQGTPDTIVLHLRTRIIENQRERIEENITFYMASTGNITLPADDFDTKLFSLIADQQTIFQSSQHTPGFIWINNGKEPPSIYKNEMLFSIPTETFLKAISADTLAISIAGNECEIDPHTIATLSDFAATLKPAFSRPEP